MTGYLFPIILIFYSLNTFTNYQFNSDKVKDISIKFKYTTYIIFPTLLFFSALLTNYFIYLFSTIINESFYFLEFHKLQIIFIFIFAILLLIRNTRKILKQLYLISYFIIFSIYWTISSYINSFSIPLFNQNYFINFTANNTQFIYINILYLFLLEILYFLWSYVSHNNNLSDWKIPKPKLSQLNPLINILLFYFGIIVYYYIFKNIL